MYYSGTATPRSFSTLHPDASDYAVGAVLSQGKIGEDRPIVFTSKMIKPAERIYGTTEKQCLAIIYAVLYFRPYLYGRECYISDRIYMDENLP